MAKGDVMPYRGLSSNGTNPVLDTLSIPVLAASSFVQGEPVFINLAGTLQECGNEPVASDFAGIAAQSGDTVGATDPNGNFRTPLGLFTPGAAPNLPVALDMTMMWMAIAGQKLITRRFSTDGTGATIIAPATANIGDTVGLELNAGNWGFDGEAATPKILVITDVLDANGESVVRSGLTGVFTVAAVIASRWTGNALGLVPTA